MEWNPEVKAKFDLTISRLPIFHRHIAEEAVSRKAEENAAHRHVSLVGEEDVISAFFSDVPTPFYSMMVRLLDRSGFDYKRYGYPKINKK
jgi:hypothetical protein